MKKSAKILSLFIAVAMIAALLPSFAFAADDIVAEFTNNSIVAHTKYSGGDIPEGETVAISNGQKYYLDCLYTTGFDFVLDEMAPASNHRAARLSTSASSWLSPRADALGIYVSSKMEIGEGILSEPAANTKNGLIVFTVPLESAGWYNVNIDGVIGSSHSNFYVFVNGQYAGYYNGYDADAAAKYIVTPNQKLNTLYLTPDASGKAKVVFAVADKKYSTTILMLYKFHLTPADESSFDSFTVTGIPETMEAGGSATVTLKANLTDGDTHRAAGFDIATRQNNNDLRIIATSGSSVEVEETSLHNGGDTATATLTAVGYGDTEITLSAIINGETKTLKKTVTVTGGTPPVEEPEETVAVFTNKYISSPRYYYPSTSTTPVETEGPINNGYRYLYTDLVTSGFTFLTDEMYETTLTAKVRGANLCDSTGAVMRDGGKIYTLAMDVGGLSSSQIGKSYLNTTEDYAATLSFSVPLNTAGWYNVNIDNGKANTGSDFYVFVNGQYAGYYSSYEDTDANIKVLGNDKLNTLYLTPDANGKAKVVFAVANKKYSTTQLYLYKFKLTPAEESEFDSFAVTGIPETMEVGNTANVTLKANLTDGDTHRAASFDLDSRLNNADLRIVATNGSSVEVTETNLHDGDDTATATLTAVHGGTTTITVSAIINGEPETKTFDIEVPSTEPGEEVSEKANVYVGAEAGGTVSATGCEANEVDEVAFGTEITATATANLDYGFAYWRNTAGTVLSTDESYTFKANGNTAVIAVFDALENPSAETTTLEFWNGNGGLIEKKTVTKGATFASAKISAPSITGYVFDKWSVEDTDTIDMLTRAVALFKEADTSYTVYVNGSPVMTGKKYGEEATVTSEKANFSVWKLGGNTVSYDKSYTFYVWGDVYLTDEEGTAEDAIPTVGISNFGGTNFIYYNVPTGYTKVEAGLLFSKSGTPTISSFYSKAVAKESKSYGQFTAVPSDDETTARAYLIFKCNESGETRVIYADIIVG